jgi:alkylhydroperoxidase/carboxymuconolactone decarboxylase family protein YurZ
MSEHSLSNKEKVLIGIGAAIAAGCRPCTQALIRAARAEGACERSIRLAIETGHYAGTCATQTMAEWAGSVQGSQPALDADFREQKEKLTALILAGATLAANSTELLKRHVGEAEALDCPREQIEVALATAHAVARTAAKKLESAATRLGFSLQDDSNACCKVEEKFGADEPPAPCSCTKGTGCG